MSNYSHNFKGMYIGNDRCYVSTQYGFAMYCSASDVSITATLLLDGVWEQHLSKFMTEYVVNDGMSFIDVGANVGWYTLLLGHHANKGKGGKFWSFEANPDLTSILNDNLYINGLNKIGTIIPKIVTNDPNLLAMDIFIRSRYTGGSSITNRSDCPDVALPVRVKATTLDNAIPVGTKIDLLRTDVEGHDFNVLMGATRILDENPYCKVMFELFPGMIKKNGHNPMDMFNMLTKRGYTFCVVDQKFTGTMSADEILNSFMNDREITDIIAVRD